MFSKEEVAKAFATTASDPQPAWSLLFFALWHSHHVLNVDCMGNIEAVLNSSANLAGSRQQVLNATSA